MPDVPTEHPAATGSAHAQNGSYMSTPGGASSSASVNDTDSDESDAVVTRPKVCPTRTPEVHYLGEFPMTCYRCHIEADS